MPPPIRIGSPGSPPTCLSAIQREANAHVSVRLVVAYDDRRISERPFLQDFAATFLVSAGGGGQVSFTIEDATTRRLLDPGWEQRRPDLTISCSYHVALTSLLHDIPVVYLFGNDYYRQKAKSLQAGFGLSPELMVDMAGPEAGAEVVAGNVLGLLSDPQRYASTIARLRLARARALALRHVVSSQLLQEVSDHVVAPLEENKGEFHGEPVRAPVTSGGTMQVDRWVVVTRTLARLRARFERIRSDAAVPTPEVQRSVDELRTTVEGLSHSVTNLSEATAGHTAWLSDLQTWTRSCVQTLSALTDTPPIPSARAQAGARAARRIDDVERLQRQLQVWTVMAWVDHADVPRDQVISVIMPTRNRCERIGRAIASIQAQTYTHWELVVVDDGSDDDTPVLLAEIAANDERIRYLRIDHAGAPAACNHRLGQGDGRHRLLPR